MKNKKLTYILLVVVAIVWFQVFNRFNFFGDEELADLIHSINSIEMVKVERNEFSLNANYRDPFDSGKITIVGEEPQPVEEIRPVVQKTVFRWPSIVYYGIIKKTQSNTPLALIEIEGDPLMLRSKDWIFDNYHVKAIYRDSIVISHARKNKTIKRLGL